MTYETESVSNMVDMLTMYRDEAIGCKYAPCALGVYKDEVENYENLHMFDFTKDMEFREDSEMLYIRVKTYTTDADIKAVAEFLIGEKT